MRLYWFIILQLTFLLGFANNSFKPTLLIFSGSDWCIPCINFEKNVLSKEAFIVYGKENLEIVKADFPQHKKQDKELVSKNEELADKYNPNGVFPLALLLDENGKIISHIKTNISSPQELIKQIEAALPKFILKEYSKKVLLMGSSFEFTIVCEDENRAAYLLNASIDEVKRIEALISEWDSTSVISEINRQSGISPVAVSEEVYQLFDRSRTLSELTHGAFDISFRGIHLYDFDKKEHSTFPDSVSIAEAVKSVNYKNISLRPQGKIMLTQKGMAVGFGASGKGYAADKVKQMLQQEGISAGVINASGDLCTWGNRPNGEPWKVGITDPDNSTKVLYWLPIENSAVATSGSYEKYFTYKGKRYAHIINPHTGFPITDKKSVSVFSQSAELSDAMATALFVMPINKGLQLLESVPQMTAIIIDSEGKVHHSKKLELIE
ncbi:FAD:protein FMN transferase [Owenweeksia hongkongensis]|uniref:FAD:protein FMN transferase n=1 Tax=Owenweeksia hongkongensis TaxID=253245 RepID=UPI003A8EA796